MGQYPGDQQDRGNTGPQYKRGYNQSNTILVACCSLSPFCTAGLQQQQQEWSNPGLYDHGTFYNNFPRAEDYNDDSQITKTLPHLQGINDQNFNTDVVDSDDHFYILRSSNDDNIHKVHYIPSLY